MSPNTWTQTLEDEYGMTLDDETAARWLQKLKESLNGVSDSELSEAIDFASQQPDNKATAKTIELHTLRIWVKWYRKTRAQSRRGYRGGAEESLIPQVKAAMLNAPDRAHRWDIMCDPRGMGVANVFRTTTCDECHELSGWAAQEWGDWVGEVETIRKNMAASLRVAINSLFLPDTLPTPPPAPPPARTDPTPRASEDAINREFDLVAERRY